MSRQVEIVSLEQVHRGFYPKSVIRLRHSRFDGTLSPVLSRDVLEIGHCVTMLPYDPADDRVLLIEQFRAAVHMMGDPGWILETTAGRVEPEEADFAAAGRREAFEESNVEVTDVAPVAAAYASPGCSTEVSHIYIGRADLSKAGGYHGLPEEGEDTFVHVLPLDEALDWAARGRIQGMPALTALFWLKLNQAEIRRRWS